MEHNRYHLSRSLSKVLRHTGKKMGFHIGDDGNILIEELLAHPFFASKGYTLEDVKTVVSTNDKQRFIITDKDGKLYIRANQGHSFEVEGLELTPITDPSLFPTVLHGTYFNVLPTIQQKGLSRMSRNHIHLTTGEYGARGVISGMRKSCEVLIYIDLATALRDGIPFFVSANGVILTPGNKDGYLPPKYFTQILRADTKDPIS